MQGIQKSFGAVKALEDGQLTLERGEIHALMGENGAGKSTLIKVLTGVYRFDSGRIELNGKLFSPGSPREAEQAGISTVYQEVNLVSTMSVADNIMLGRHPTRLGLLRKKAIREQASKAIARLGLNLDVSRPLRSYSLAIQQMVAIARALDVQANLLILDEPTSSLDEREVAFLFQVMRQLRDQGMAILFVTHFLDQVYAVSNAITVLRNGKFVSQNKASDLPRIKLISDMLGRSFEEMQKLSHDAQQAAAQGHGSDFLQATALQKRGIMANVDLTIGTGEVVGLAGLLGSGRSETAKMLFGVHPPDRGEIKINNQAVTIRSPKQAIRQGMAFCSEDRKTEGIIPHLSVRENLILASQASRGAFRLLSRKEQETLTSHYIRALNIKTESPETPIMNLSGGNQQKVLLARWLATQPRLILLDEPTRGIDVGAKAEIEALVHSLRSRGMSVLFISSDLEEVARTCQRVVVLRDRRKIGELAGDEIRPQQIMHMIAHHE